MKLIDIIEVFIAGDWGEETYSKETPCAVTCVRGADIIPISEYDLSVYKKRRGKVPLLDSKRCVRHLSPSSAIHNCFGQRILDR